MASPHTIRPALYRAAQFFAAVRASLPAWAGGLLDVDSPAIAAWVAAMLPAARQQQLFGRMPPNDRRHALAVARMLLEAGRQHPALLQAALLHDVGKSLGQPLPHRVLIVLLEAFWPAGLAWLSQADQAASVAGQFVGAAYREALERAGWWRRPFIIHAHHPAIGAAMAAEAGCDPLAVRLIARHQEDLRPAPAEIEAELLAALQWADNLN